jgi:hypothetical protein
VSERETANPKYCLHQFESGPRWGVIFGVSKCVLCGAVARSEHFHRSQSTVAEQQRKERV